MLEADQTELTSYVSGRLAPDGGPVPAEPTWLREAFDESWTRVLAEVEPA